MLRTQLVKQPSTQWRHPAYAEAVKVLARMAALRSAEAQADHVAALKARFNRKRNFMKLLG